MVAHVPSVTPLQQNLCLFSKYSCHSIYKYVRYTHNFSLGTKSCSRAKVNQLDVARSRDEHILWLNVPMDKPQVMEVIEACRYFCQIEPRRERER